MVRRLILILCVLATPLPALAANKDIERLQIQISSLQGQLADLAARLRGHAARAQAPQRVAGRPERGHAAARGGPAHAGGSDLRRPEGHHRPRVGPERARADDAGGGAAPASPIYTLPAPAPAAAGGPAAAPITPAALRPARRARAPSAPPAPAPRELYTQAYADYARGNYDLAIQEYTDYLRNYPDTDLSDNAQYWIGECQYSKQKFPEAIAAWDELFRAVPVERQAARRALQEGHGPREAGAPQPGPARVPLRRRPLPQLGGRPQGPRETQPALGACPASGTLR